LTEIMRYHCHGRDVQNPLSYSKADPLSKKDLSFRLVGWFIQYIGRRMTDLIILT